MPTRARAQRQIRDVHDESAESIAAAMDAALHRQLQSEGSFSYSFSYYYEISADDTPAATPAPSLLPNPAPSALPVPAPTALPVPAPTSFPIPAPTATPVPAPTATPVPAPTSSSDPPTAMPVPAPTALPVPAPTRMPIVAVSVGMAGVTCAEYDTGSGTGATDDTGDTIIVSVLDDIISGADFSDPCARTSRPIRSRSTWRFPRASTPTRPRAMPACS